MLDGGFGFDLLKKYLLIGVDIALVWYVIYKLLMLIRGTKAIQLLQGIVVVLMIRMASIFFNLKTLQWLTYQAILWGFLVIIILFQPELRRALEQLGRGGLFMRSTKSEEDTLAESIEAIVDASEYMAKRRIGAIITIERETGIGDYAETGTLINGEITQQLITNIFTPNTPLHDGAMIIKDQKIVAAACYLPLSENPHISKDLGTRHRAAVGISEVTDALTITVSEETGNVSIAESGELKHDISIDELREYLHENLTYNVRSSNKTWSWRGRKDG